ncbi:carbohydrate kinase family protein [Mesorhizobium sp. BAC0120]|uniref:carbohydrate kinase family protein n=1 Tax=Mesorhizobium sp. BAC0120 TaxID=3090670 RepID=UPI00298C57EB|nr:carbohydrate kinase family protein [Mesorhizobium sp. BAC0120]MDW6022463.1 carbohydrate kinase family protein [Mesorhizobium sp. BAC0120]
MRIAITGYASLDHVATLDGVPRPGRTTTILGRPDNAWPRLGGSPSYVAAALVASGVPEAFPVSWIGDDSAAGAYLTQLTEKRIPHDGIVVVPGARTPIAILAYEPDGGCICLYDPGMSTEPTLSDLQRELIAKVDWVCVTIGPQDATAAVLETIGPAARLAWVVKHDPRAMPVPLAARLAARADLICCSQAESAFLEEALASAAPRQGQIRIETHGRAGAAFTCGEANGFVAASPVCVSDPTGAGDSFAGGVLAALAKGETDLASIVEAGHHAAVALLATRRKHES